MMMERALGRRGGRIRRGIIAIAAVALVAGVWQGVAAATSAGPGKTAKAPIQLNNDHCGVRITDAKKIGTTSLTRVGDEVTVTYTLTKGDPNTTYEVQLWQAFGPPADESCDFVADVDFLTTNGSGSGSVTGTVALSEKGTNFFATGWNETTEIYNDGLRVKLAS